MTVLAKPVHQHPPCPLFLCMTLWHQPVEEPEEVGVGEDQGVGEQAWHQGEAQASQGGGTLCPAPCQHPYPACPSTHPLACQGHSFAVLKDRIDRCQGSPLSHSGMDSRTQSLP